MFGNPHALPLTLTASLWAPMESGDTWKSSPMWPRFSSHCNLPVHLCFLIMRCTESKGRSDSPKSTGDHDFLDSLLLLKCDPSVLLVPWRHLIRTQQYRPPTIIPAPLTQEWCNPIHSWGCGQSEIWKSLHYLTQLPSDESGTHNAWELWH